MAETDETLTEPTDGNDELPAPRPQAAPIESRFMYVDIAALRAKQLRRGALVRLSDDDPAAQDVHRPQPHKAERIAMEEVKRGLVLWEVAPFTKLDPR